MSMENLKEYVRLCATDPELYAKSKEIGLNDLESHMAESGKLGLDWTTEDMIEFRKELIHAEGDLEDLTEEELEQMAGGAVTVGLGVAAAVAIGIGGAVGLGGAGVGLAVTSSTSTSDW
ncbi:MAG: hypothetical protein OXI64_04535 [Defluviicoccus sp.]|nr:hypothetical protein [Defluviicoccus sp.]